ncbi:hypothetical protein ACTXT7_000214 [Hymenolepis weldensis]
MIGSVWQTEGVELSSVYCKRALKELNEDPEQVQAHLESFRRWIKSMPHLNCPTETIVWSDHTGGAVVNLRPRK